MNTPTPTIEFGNQYLINGRTMQVIHVDEELITLRSLEHLHTLSMTLDMFMTAVAKQAIVLIARSPCAGTKALAFLDPHDPQVVAAERKRHYVSRAMELLGGPLPEAVTTALIAKLGIEINDPSPPCYSSVYKWTKYYRKHNCNRFCLLKDKSIALRGKRLDPEVETLIQEMIEHYYLTQPPATVESIHAYVHGQIILINRSRIGYSTRLLKNPSLSTIRRKIAKLCSETTDRRRFGWKYEKKHYPSSKHTEDPAELLELAEIDSHLCDINILDDKGECLGHILWWAVILEVKTRTVIGWELSATYPCAEKTIRAVMKAVQAVPGEERRRGKPNSIHSDNGVEFVNERSRDFLDRLNISYTRGPTRTPNARARLERFFKTFENWCNQQAGTTMTSLLECEYYNSTGDAAYTAANMHDYIEYWIENIYHQKKHKSLNMPPAVAWERAMNNRLPPEKFSAEELDLLCRGVEFACVSAAGRVQFLSLSWWGAGLHEIRAKLKPGQRAKCFYNPLNLGEILVTHPDGKHPPQRAYATRPAYQDGLTLTEHEKLHQAYLDEGRAFDDSEADLALLLLHQRMADEYERSHNRLSGAKPKSKETTSSLFSRLPSVQEIEVVSPEEGSVTGATIPTFKIDQL